MAGTVEQEAAIWKKLHDTREEHVEQARRARDYQAKLHRKSNTIQLLLRRYFDLVYRMKMGGK